MYRANYPVDNPSDYWKMSIYIVFLDHLVEEISKRVVSNDERFLASYLNPASLLNIASEIIDRLLMPVRQILQRKVDCMDEVGCWKIRWALVDDKPETT
jgi:hypothetical protein